MTNKEQSRIEHAYSVIANKHPEITNQRLLELLTRKYLMRQKIIRVVLLFLLAFFCIHIGTMLDSATHPFLRLLCSLLVLTGTILPVVSICKFAKSLHSPLTPNEAKELEDYDAVEKGGQRHIDLSQYDNNCLVLYEQQKYDNASTLKKLFLRLKRISFVISLFILIILGFGIFNIVSGIDNINTYAERNKNATEVTAYIDHFEKHYNEKNEDWSYQTYWKYTYNGSEYIYLGSSYSSTMTVGDSKTILIDSQNPECIIENNGSSSILTGCICCVVAILFLTYAFCKVNEVGSTFSVFNLFWMLFVCAAIGFGVWGISMLISGDLLAGILVSVFGVPMFLGGAWLFYAGTA